RVDPAVRPDAARDPHREPAAAGAEVGDDAALADVQGVHDLVGTLIGVAVRPFELAEQLGREEARVLRAERRRAREDACSDEGRQAPRDHVAFVSAPGIPGAVIASGERICASLSSGTSFRSRTMSMIERPVLTDSFAMSAVW